MTGNLQVTVDIGCVMIDPVLPPVDSTEGWAFDEFFFRTIRILRDHDIIDSVLNDLCQEVLEAGKLGRKAPVQFSAAGILTLPPLDHHMVVIAIKTFHNARNPVPVLKTTATNRANRFLPITLNKKHLLFCCKSDRNLLR